MWEAASLLKDTCLIIDYWGWNKKYYRVFRQQAYLTWLLQQQSFWGLKNPKWSSEKHWEKKAHEIATYSYILWIPCYKPRTQVLIPKAESLPALHLLSLLSPLQDHLRCLDGYCCRKLAYYSFTALFKHCCFKNLNSNNNSLYYIYYLQNEIIFKEI